jgi:hypothetical protein
MTVENPHAGQGMVVLDIGDDIGALVVSTPADMAGVEIEICPVGARNELPDEGAGWWHGEWRSHSHDDGTQGHVHSQHAGPAWPHVAVLGRPTLQGTAHAAVFPGLRTGSYELWVRPDEPTALTATVSGGQVTNAAWPAP